MTLAARLREALVHGHSRTFDMMRVDPRMDDDVILHPAAVLVAITDRPEPGLILTRRSSRMRTHAGQVAFPGGRVDAGDADEIAAALREAEEEIALPRERVDVIGMSDRYHTFTGFDIVPVLGVIPPDLPLRPCADEVAALFEVPLAYALDPASRARKSIDWHGATRHYHEIMWEEHRIWGVTAAIIVNLSKRLGHDG